MTPLLQVGAATLMIALSYAVILAISTVAFIVVDRRYDIIPVKEQQSEAERSEQEEQDDQAIPQDIR